MDLISGTATQVFRRIHTPLYIFNGGFQQSNSMNTSLEPSISDLSLIDTHVNFMLDNKVIKFYRSIFFGDIKIFENDSIVLAGKMQGGIFDVYNYHNLSRNKGLNFWQLGAFILFSCLLAIILSAITYVVLKKHDLEMSIIFVVFALLCSTAYCMYNTYLHIKAYSLVKNYLKDHLKHIQN